MGQSFVRHKIKGNVSGLGDLNLVSGTTPLCPLSVSLPLLTDVDLPFIASLKIKYSCCVHTNCGELRQKQQSLICCVLSLLYSRNRY